MLAEPLIVCEVRQHEGSARFEDRAVERRFVAHCGRWEPLASNGAQGPPVGERHDRHRGTKEPPRETRDDLESVAQRLPGRHIGLGTLARLASGRQGARSERQKCAMMRSADVRVHTAAAAV
jgi:hypothetical protein